MIPQKDQEYLRQLAEELRVCAESDVNLERRERWYRHNRGELVTPPIIAETYGVDNVLVGELKCTSEVGRNFEMSFRRQLTGFNYVKDDKVIESEFVVGMNMDLHLFGYSMNDMREYPEGDDLAYEIKHPFKDLENDLKNLKPSYYTYDADETEKNIQIAEDCFGDILKIRVHNFLWDWKLGLSEWAVNLIGMQDLFFAYMDTPELTDFLYAKMSDDLLRILMEQEEAELLTLNNGNDYVGSGSRGFTDDLPAAGFDGKVRLVDRWANMNSQESIGVSPDFYMEHIYPHYEKIAKCFGKTYYGCCEDVSLFWEQGLKDFPNMNKVSISPFCNQEFMAEKLRGGKIIYSRKPSPNFIGEDEFNPEAYREHIEETLKIADGCPLEFLMRDIYRLGDDHSKIPRAVQIIRDACDKFNR